LDLLDVDSLIPSIEDVAAEKKQKHFEANQGRRAAM
jgi:hypothetical protein